jgi:REP element-mobilizing transposase RayT
MYARHRFRLEGYDYSQEGMYFVTICLNQRIPKSWPDSINPNFPTFGKIENSIMFLNDMGKIVQEIWNEMPKHYSYIRTDEFVVMPDHVHWIIEICDVVQNKDSQIVNEINGGFAKEKNPMFHDNLPRIIRWFKGRIAFECHKIDSHFKWQRNYHEHIIRNDAEYLGIAKYIHDNPILWGKNQLDKLLQKITSHTQTSP